MTIRHFFSSLSSVDRKFIFLVILGATLLTSIPYLSGVVLAGHDFVYLGMSPIAAADANVYYSFMKQVAQGSFFIENLHTSEPQVGSIIHPLWLVLGWVTGLFQLSPPLVFHVARVLLGVLFLLVAYGFLLEVFPKRWPRNAAFILLAFSSGVGTILGMGVELNDPTQILLLLPADQWVSESNTFLTLFHSPLFILSQLLILILLWYFVHMERSKSIVLPCFAMVLLGLMHPYDVVTIAAVLPVFFLVRLARDAAFTLQVALSYFRRMVIVGACAIPPLVYFWVVTKIEPAIGLWARQNITRSPPIHSYLIGYGVVLIFAVVGVALFRRTRSSPRLMVLTWLVIGAALLYLPVQINRRFTNGLHIPLVILAASGLYLFWQWLMRMNARHEIRRVVVLSVIGWFLGIALFFNTLTIVVKAVYWQTDPETSIFFAPKDTTRAMDWLGMHAPLGSAVLSHSFNGNILPARTGLRVYVGHGHQTIGWSAKTRLVNTWFFGTNDDDVTKLKFLQDEGIRYILFTDAEDQLGDFEPREKPYLKLLVQFGTASVYQLVLP